MIPGINMDNLCLWTPPEQAGWLQKQTHSKIPKWRDRFFVLKGSFLFYFVNRKSVNKLHGVIPLENAKVETEAPPGFNTSRAAGTGQGHIITITLHTQHAYTCKHAFYVLQAPNAEVQTAWVNALWQAAIPRATLVLELSGAGRLTNLVATYAQQIQQCFPTADASVLSTSGRVRISNAVGNIGSLAGMLRRAKQTDRKQQDITKLPILPAITPHLTTMLARTASGSLISQAAAEWTAPQQQQEEEEEEQKQALPQRPVTSAPDSAAPKQQGDVSPIAMEDSTTIAVITTSPPSGWKTNPLATPASPVGEGGLREKVAQLARQSAALNQALATAQEAEQVVSI